MGQYYKPINLENRTFVLCYDYGSGAKLMEHSWLKNDFVGGVESLLVKGGPWYKKPIIWAGDYAEETITLDKDSEYHKKGELVNDYAAVQPSHKCFPQGGPVKENYILNHTKQEFVDKRKVPNNDGWQIHPLPLLTCDGNGQGGGDFHTDSERNSGNFNLIGSWKGDVISIESRKPTKKMGFKEIDFDLMEA